MEARPERRQVKNAETQWCVDPQPPVRLDRGGRCDRLGFGHVLENGKRPIVERLSDLGQRKPPRGTVEQPGTERFLQLVDVTGHVGRRGVELVRRAGKAALADHGGEDLISS